MSEEIEKLNEKIGHRLVKLGEATIIDDRNREAMHRMKLELNQLFQKRDELSAQPKPEIIISEK